MKRCPKCNAQFGDGATYCEYCGVKLVKPFICPNCGEEVDENASFCPKCGKAFHDPVSDVSLEKNDNVTIEQYKNEIANYKRKRLMMVLIGSGLMAIGLALFLIFLFLFYKLDINSEEFVSKGYLYLFIMVLGELIIDGGLAMVIVSGIVFSKKISNRQRIIDGYNDL